MAFRFKKKIFFQRFVSFAHLFYIINWHQYLKSYRNSFVKVIYIELLQLKGITNLKKV